MKILIASASTGNGHVKAAEAIEKAVQLAHPDIEVKHVNVLDFVPASFRAVYQDGYSFLADRAPLMWGWLYNATNIHGNRGVVQRAINNFQRQCAAPFLEFLHDYKPQRIISTHFLIPQIISSRPADLYFPVDTVVTDYDLHHIWFDPMVRRYFVADEEVAAQFSAFSVPENKIIVSGIPIDPMFAGDVSRPAVLAKLKLHPNHPTVLFLAGALGFGHLEKVIRRSMQFDRPAQFIAVAGKNKKLLAEIRKLAPPSHIRLAAMGFVNNMHELMAAADVVVTKPGGLTTSECFARGCAMVVHSPIPGQEEKNAEYIVRHGAGLRAHNADQISQLVSRLLSNPAELTKLRVNSRACARPRAAYIIAENTRAKISAL